MKNLEIDEIFIFYGAPQVMSAKDKEGNYYMCTLYTIDSRNNLNYITSKITEKELKDLKSNTIDLLSIYQNRSIYKAIAIMDDIFYIDSEIIPEPWMLPDEDLYIADRSDR